MQSSVRKELIAVLVGVTAGCGIAWMVWLATRNIAVTIGIAGPIAYISNGFLRNRLRKNS